MVSFHVLSDLHLELFPGFRLDPARVAAPYLILAGDIGDPNSEEYCLFLQHCATLFDGVFMVLGNHEAYGGSLATAVAAVQAICDTHANVHLLQQTVVDLPTSNIRVVGTTLWSHIPKREAFNTECFISDYRRIDGFRVHVNNALHASDVKWIDAELTRALADDKRLVVVTHHAPLVLGTSHAKHTGSKLNCAFATDLPHLIRDPVEIWVHGHTHHTHASMVNGRLLMANQRGYPDNLDEGQGFDPYNVVKTRAPTW
jgi:predicted phosphodiesterase